MPKRKSITTRKAQSLRRLSVRAVLRSSPDLDAIASTVEAMAIAQAEKEAQDAKHSEEHRS